ncbi:MAG: outer membrane beta-barrel protein [Opitutaceae bacterium]|nr:outer membrane beta-barrel protein [Verrucomicrobiales bacterium]
MNRRSAPRWIRATLMAALSMIPGFCDAQEALRNAIQQDQGFNQRQLAAAKNAGQSETDRPAFTVGASLGIEFDDNISLVQNNRLSDVSISPGMNFAGQWPISQTSQLSFGIGVAYQKYLKYSEYDQLTITPNSALALDIPARDFVFTFYDSISYSQDVISQAALSGVAQFPQIVNTVGTRISWVPSEWIFQAGYAHGTTFSPGGDVDYLNGSSEQFFARAGYRLARATTVGLESSATLQDYDSSTQADSTSYTFGPYIEWKITEALEINLRGGLSYNTFEPTNSLTQAETLDSYYSYVSINHRLTDFVSHSLGGGHSIEPGVNQGSDYVESSTVNYQITWALRRTTSLSGNVSYQIGNQPNIGPGGQEEDFNQFGFGFGIQQGLTQKLSSSLAYSFTKRDSNLPDRGYTQNTVLLTFNYQF